MQRNRLALLDIDLELFDGEGGAPSSGAGQSAASGVASATSNQDVDPKNVVYGKDVDTLDGDKKPEKDVDPEHEFEDLIKTKYKDQFAKRTQSIIDKRFKEVKTMEKQLSQLQGLQQLLSQKYGVEDASELHQKLEAEYIEEMAYQNDMTPENYRKIMEADRIKAEEQRRQQEYQQQQQVNEAVERWMQQAQEMKAEYPDFDLREAMQDDQFLGLIKSNVPVKTAYELLHFDNLKEQIRKDAEAKTAQSVQAKKARPNEAAMRGQTGAIVKNDVKSLTKHDREEVIRRAQRGELISF